MQQNTQQFEALAAALLFCLQQLDGKEHQEQQEQQRRQQQGLQLLGGVLSGPSNEQQLMLQPLILLIFQQLLGWLHTAPGLAAELTKRFDTQDCRHASSGSSGSGGGAGGGYGYHLQGMWLAGMQVWQLTCLLDAVGDVGSCEQLVLSAYCGMGT
jgi:hypothetical protein